MLKDITIGQYFPGNSLVHRLDAAVKIILTIVFIVMIFAADTAVSMLMCVVFLIVSYALTRLSPKLIIKSFKPVVPVLIITAVLNVFFFDGDVIFKLWFLEITDDGLKNAAFMLVRVIALITGSSILTYTTSPIELTNASEKLMSPLKKFKFPVHELAMMMTIALRFVPTLIEETDKIISAQKARGADFENGKLIDRARAVVPVIIPLFVSSFRRAEELALAMECRCYRGGDGRTKLKMTSVKPIDIVAVIVTLTVFVGVISVNILLK